MTYVTRKYINGAYRRVSFQTKEYHVKLEEVMSAQQPVTSGNLFCQRAMQAVYNKSMQQLMVEQKNAWTTMRDERPLVTLKKNWMPTMTWKVPERELLNLHQTKALTSFSLDLGVAEKFGFIEQKKRRGGICAGAQSAVHPSFCDLR